MPLFGRRGEELAEIREAPAAPTPKPAEPPKPEAAPLFVKVERYRDILNKLAQLRATFENIDSILKVRSAADKVRSSADELLFGQLQVARDSVASLQQQLTKPPALEPMVITKPITIAPELEELSAELSRLQEQLAALK